LINDSQLSEPSFSFIRCDHSFLWLGLVERKKINLNDSRLFSLLQEKKRQMKKGKIERIDSWHRASELQTRGFMTSEDNLIICQTIKLFDDVSRLPFFTFCAPKQLKNSFFFLTEQEPSRRENNKLNRCLIGFSMVFLFNCIIRMTLCYFISHIYKLYFQSPPRFHLLPTNCSFLLPPSASDWD
jgi:hypothetical protein